MLKIFQTGDNHIGLKYAKHENGEVLIQSRIDAFDGMINRANQEKCDLFVITGDLFDNTRLISKGVIRSVLRKLSQFEGAYVVVLPGNHDYYDKDVKLWKDFQEEMTSFHNILLLNEYRPYQIPECRTVLYPAQCTSRNSVPGENNLGWIREEQIGADEFFHIGIAHGAVEGETIDSEGKYFLMSRSELEGIPVDAWLIGHTHVPFPQNLTEEFAPCDRILNAGTHVQTDVNCNTEGMCFIVEIGDDKSLRAKKVHSGNLRFCRKQILLSPGTMEEAIERAIADLEDNSIVDLVLTGTVSAEEYEDRNVVLERLLSRFLEGTYSDADLSKQITRHQIETEFPETSASAQLLTALLDEPKEVQLVYDLLQTLKEGN